MLEINIMEFKIETTILVMVEGLMEVSIAVLMEFEVM